MRKNFLLGIVIAVLILWCLVFCITANSQVTVTANAKILTTAPVTTLAYFQVDLQNCTPAPTIGGTAIDSKTVKGRQFGFDALGNTSMTIYRNDEISCNGVFTSYYTGSIYSARKLVWQKRCQFSAATDDWATCPALNTDPPSPAANYARRNGDNVFSGVQDFRGATLLGVTALSSAVEWADVLNKPTAFVPSAHIHLKADISDFPALATVATSGRYEDLSNKPTLGTIASHAATEYQPAGSYEPANANIQAHVASTSNPHATTAAQAGAIAVTDKTGVGAKVPSVDANPSDGCAQFATGKLTSTGAACGSGGGGVTNHSLLTNLDYPSAGHTGFQPALGYTPEQALTFNAPLARAANAISIDLSVYQTTAAATTALATKADKVSIAGATKTKVTYNTQGIVTAGADATTADIADSLDRRYVTDAQRTVITNTSGTNAGDETAASIRTKLGITTLSGSNTGDQDLSGKADKVSIAGATKTKVSYNAQGIVTAGADATTSDIADSLDKRYVTDAQRTVISNTSGTNAGDETAASIRTKLGITVLSGSNTGDQDLSGLVTKTTTVNGKPLSANVALVASDVGALADPAANGIVKRTAANTTAAAAAADVVAIFGGGACAGYLKSDGACDTPAGGGTTPLTAYAWGSRDGTLSFTAGQTRWWGIMLPVSISVSKLGVYVTTLDATGTYRFSVYNDAGTRVLTTVAQTLPATGNVAISFSEGLTTLPAGKYRFTLSSASSTAVIAATNATQWSFGSGLVTGSATPPTSFTPPADSWTGQGYVPYVVLYQ